MARRPHPTKRGSVYELTQRGRELKTVCDAMGEWGARWLEIEPRHLEPAYVLWATCRLVDVAKLPAQGVVVRFDLRDGPEREFWMLLRQPRAELCTSYPGQPEDLIVKTDSETLVHWHLRRLTFRQAQRDGRLRLEGAPSLIRAFPTWLKPSPFAHVPPAPSTDPGQRVAPEHDFGEP